MGTLDHGDNRDILRRYLKDETVDLVHLDPPFNSAPNCATFFHDTALRMRVTAKQNRVDLSARWKDGT